MKRSTAAPVAILVAVLTILVVVLVIAAPGPGGDDDYTSTGNDKVGTLALYDWLQAVGDNVDRVDVLEDTRNPSGVTPGERPA